MQTTRLAPSVQRTVPGDLAMWFFILAELAVFGVFFAIYGVVRARQPALFAAGQHALALTPAILNTLLLIAGSGAVAAAVQNFAHGRVRRGEHWLLGTLLCGSCFLLLKGSEFVGKFSAGITLSSNDFWMFYLSLAGFHYLHVVLGMVIIAAVYRRARQGNYDAANHVGVETAAAYWHMVDLVWLVLFALLYVAH